MRLWGLYEMYNDCATRMCRGHNMFSMCLYLCMFTVLRMCAGDTKTICVLNHVTILPPSSCFVRNVEQFSRVNLFFLVWHVVQPEKENHIEVINFIEQSKPEYNWSPWSWKPPTHTHAHRSQSSCQPCICHRPLYVVQGIPKLCKRSNLPYVNRWVFFVFVFCTHLWKIILLYF